MNKLYSLILKLQRDERGQDMVEYAQAGRLHRLYAAGKILPGISSSISVIFAKMARLVANAAVVTARPRPRPGASTSVGRWISSAIGWLRAARFAT